MAMNEPRELAGEPVALRLLYFYEEVSDRAQLPLASLPPSTLIRELYSAGEINRAQFESLMRLLPIRNQVVHGLRSQDQIDAEPLRQLVNALLADATAA